MASPPSHLADLLHALLTPGQNPTWVSLGTAHPAWGQREWWAAGSPPQPDTSGETPQNCHWHFCSLQAARGHELAGTPQNIPVGLRELELSWAGQGEEGKGSSAGGGLQLVRQIQGMGLGSQGWKGLQAGAARPGDTLLLLRKGGWKTHPFDPTTPWAALTFIRRCEEPGQLCLLLPVEGIPGNP